MVGRNIIKYMLIVNTTITALIGARILRLKLRSTLYVITMKFEVGYINPRTNRKHDGVHHKTKFKI